MSSGGVYTNQLIQDIGLVLAVCLQDVIQVWPEDPIAYMAHWLYRYMDNNLYFENKVGHLKNVEANDKLERYQRKQSELHRTNLNALLVNLKAVRKKLSVESGRGPPLLEADDRGFPLQDDLWSLISSRSSNPAPYTRPSTMTKPKKSVRYFETDRIVSPRHSAGKSDSTSRSSKKSSQISSLSLPLYTNSVSFSDSSLPGVASTSSDRESSVAHEHWPVQDRTGWEVVPDENRRKSLSNKVSIKYHTISSERLVKEKPIDKGHKWKDVVMKSLVTDEIKLTKFKKEDSRYGRVDAWETSPRRQSSESSKAASVEKPEDGRTERVSEHIDGGVDFEVEEQHVIPRVLPKDQYYDHLRTSSEESSEETDVEGESEEHIRYEEEKQDMKQQQLNSMTMGEHYKKERRFSRKNSISREGIFSSKTKERKQERRVDRSDIGQIGKETSKATVRKKRKMTASEGEDKIRSPSDERLDEDRLRSFTKPVGSDVSGRENQVDYPGEKSEIRTRSLTDENIDEDRLRSFKKPAYRNVSRPEKQAGLTGKNSFSDVGADSELQRSSSTEIEERGIETTDENRGIGASRNHEDRYYKKAKGMSHTGKATDKRESQTFSRSKDSGISHDNTHHRDRAEKDIGHDDEYRKDIGHREGGKQYEQEIESEDGASDDYDLKTQEDRYRKVRQRKYANERKHEKQEVIERTDRDIETDEELESEDDYDRKGPGMREEQSGRKRQSEKYHTDQKEMDDNSALSYVDTTLKGARRKSQRRLAHKKVSQAKFTTDANGSPDREGADSDSEENKVVAKSKGAVKRKASRSSRILDRKRSSRIRIGKKQSQPIAVAPGIWYFQKDPGVMVCDHPVLGELRAPKRPKAIVDNVLDREDMPCESLYDSDIYVVCDRRADDEQYTDRMLVWTGETWVTQDERNPNGKNDRDS